MTNKFLIVAGFILVCTPIRLLGATVTKSTDEGEFTPGTLNQGLESPIAFANPTNDNYFTGFEEANAYGEFRGYFIFDLDGISGSVTGATLQVRLGSYSLEFQSAATIGFFDVSTDPSTLRQNGSLPQNSPSFNDLGTGNMYGSFTVTVSDTLPPTTIMNVSLDAAALADINSHLGGYFAIGSTLITPPLGPNNVYVFGASAGYVNHLVLSVVPEPASYSLALLAFGGLVALAARRRNS